ncbi:MAG: hypothetical protein WCC21_09375 [Candidatus Acidiferrales bacterium]
MADFEVFYAASSIRSTNDLIGAHAISEKYGAIVAFALGAEITGRSSQWLVDLGYYEQQDV